jgi:beta-phosphoglucomutase-like phosphatase (HAD superfamily)
MRKILTDYDGILIETEWAKGLGWYLACLSLKDDEPDVNEQLIKEIEQRRESARLIVEQLAEERKKEVERAKSFGGGTRYQFAKRIWQEFYLPEGERREPDDKDKEFITNVLTAQRGRIRGPVLEWFSQPIKDNLRFFKELYEAMKDTYLDEHPIGLVTLSTSKGLKKQFEWTRGGETFWKEFPELPNIFGEYSERGYPYAECAGDKGIAYKGLSGNDVKVAAYKILCGKLGVHPADTITFEDTEDGLKAAKRAHVICVAYKSEDNLHNLSEANAIVDNLYKLTDLIPFILRGDPVAVVEEIREYLRSQASP